MSVKAPASLPHIGLLLEAAEGSGTLAATLDALTSVGVGTVVVGGTLAKTLAALTVSSSGTAVFNQGSIDSPVPLPHLSLLLYTITGIVGNTVKTLEDMTCVAEGDAPGNEIWTYDDDDISARAPIYWPHAYNVDWFQTDTVLRGDTGGVFGVVGSNLDPLTAVLTAAVEVVGTLARTLDDLTVDEITGTVEVSCTLAKTFDAMTCVSTTDTLDDIVGTSFIVLDALVSVSTTTVEVAGTLAQTLGNMTCSAASTNEISGTLNITFQGINQHIDGSVLDDIVCVLIQTLDPLTCVATGIVGPVEVIPAQPGFAGGWRRKVRRFEQIFPTPEEIQEERERLGILPKRAQKLIKETVEKATAVSSEKQAALLAAAYLEDIQQRSLMDRLRNKASKSKTKWNDDLFVVTRAMILDELRKKADADMLEQLIKEQEAEEAEINEILELWMEEL